MPPIRRFNRARKPKVHWEPPPPAHRPPTRKQQPPLFIIHADSPEDLTTQLHEDLIKGLSPQLSEEDLSNILSSQLYDEDLSNYLSQLSDEDLSNVLSLQLSDEDLSNALSFQLSDENLSNTLSIQLSDEDLSKVLNAQLYKNLDVNSSYQLQFLSKDRTDKSQNLSEDSTSVKLFQLFFIIEEIKNIIKQINQQAVCIDFKYS